MLVELCISLSQSGKITFSFLIPPEYNQIELFYTNLSWEAIGYFDERQSHRTRSKDLTEQRPRILFLFSDTGGGHRSAAEAIIEAIQSEYGDQYEPLMLDLFKNTSLYPFNRFPQWYPRMTKVPILWDVSFRLSNRPLQMRWISSLAWPYIRRDLKKIIHEAQADMIVSVHPAYNTVVLRVLEKNPVPFMTVVTDMVSVHALWIDKRTDLCAVATEAAYQTVISFGLPPEKVFITGLPVAQRFCRPPASKLDLREQLGWPQQKPIVLLVGGGEGMGPIEQNAVALAEAGLDINLVIVAGRNQALQQRLEKRSWPVPTRIYGFVRNMPEFMCASDILLTKAGPGTITEALNAGLPMILYSRIPGQEDGNVTYVVDEGAGVWAPSPTQMVEAARNWVEHPEARQEAVNTCQRIARPDAARDIAHLIAKQLGK